MCSVRGGCVCTTVSVSYVHCTFILSHCHTWSSIWATKWAHNYDNGVVIHGLNASKDVKSFREQTVT